MKNLLFVSQGVIQIFVGIGAVASGALLIIAPSGELLQMSTDMLKGTPFDDYLIPGIILFLVNGLGQIVGGILTLRRNRIAGFLGAALGIALMIWLFVQVNMIGGGHILQYSYFMIGVIETTLSFVIQDHLA
jgi:hypothetical protein